MFAKRLVLATAALLLALTGCSAAEPSASPSGDAPDGSIVLPEAAGLRFGAEDATFDVEIHADPQCPWCARLETAIGDQLDELVEEEEIALTVVLRSFLDDSTGKQVSKQAANAVLCVQPSGHGLEFYSTMMKRQPEPQENQTPWDAGSLTALAKEVGADDDATAACIKDIPHADLIDDMEAKAFSDGVTGTPRLFLDGREAPQVIMQGLMEGQITMRQLLEANTPRKQG